MRRKQQRGKKGDGNSSHTTTNNKCKRQQKICNLGGIPRASLARGSYEMGPTCFA